ncbi:MAG: hypothetical protein AAGA95_15925, partial [Pseudomonadota bacterium]
MRTLLLTTAAVLALGAGPALAGSNTSTGTITDDSNNNVVNIDQTGMDNTSTYLIESDSDGNELDVDQAGDMGDSQINIQETGTAGNGANGNSLVTVFQGANTENASSTVTIDGGDGNAVDVQQVGTFTNGTASQVALTGRNADNNTVNHLQSSSD